MGEQPAMAENPPCQHGDFSSAQAGGEVGEEEEEIAMGIKGFCS